MVERRINYSGLVVSVVGFVLTRFTVTLTAMDGPVEFLFTAVVPLLLGLSLAAFGVVLAVGTYEAAFVRRVALWCLLGVGTMVVFVAITVLGGAMGPSPTIETVRRQAHLSNFLIGGAVGGTLTGLYAASNYRQRVRLRRQANRLTVLNRLLRDQVINAATVIDGNADPPVSDRAVEVIGRKADDIIETIDNVKHLSDAAEAGDGLETVDLEATVSRALDRVEAEFPDAESVYHAQEGPVEVRANAQLEEAVRHLVENAIEHSDAPTPRVEVSVETTGRTARLSVVDNGPGLPPDQRALLEEGHIAEFDDPSTGFGLNIVRLLVESFDGTVRTAVADGTTVTVEFARASAVPVGDETGSAAPRGVSPTRLAVAVSAGLVAGVTMGLTLQATGGFISVIGALYGIGNPVVGWITHLFHSVVFALACVAVLSTGPPAYTDGLARRVAVGMAFGVALWVFAAGVVMPTWLLLVGVDASVPLPNLTPGSLLAHAVWGVTVAAVYHAADRWLRGRRDRPAAD